MTVPSRLRNRSVRISNASSTLSVPGSLLMRVRSSNSSVPDISTQFVVPKSRGDSSIFVTFLPACSFVPVPPFGDGDANPSAVFGNCHIRNADLLAQPLHRLRPNKIVKLLPRETECHDSRTPSFRFQPNTAGSAAL